MKSDNGFAASLLTLVAVAGAVAALGAQSAAPAAAGAQSAPPPPAASSAPPAKSTTATLPAKGGKALTLSGCVTPESGKKGGYTLVDEQTGTTYHLTGTNVKGYLWRHVQIVGGLVPSATLAAQAGSSFDPVKAAEAAEGNRPSADVAPMVQLRVNRVQPLAGGTCAPPSN